MSNICGWKQSSKLCGLFFFSLFQREGGKHKFFDFNRQNIYTWCLRLCRSRLADQHAVMRVIPQIPCSLVSDNARVQWGRNVFTNSDQEPAAHLSGDFNQRQRKPGEALGFTWDTNLTERKFFRSFGEQECEHWRRWDFPEAVDWKYIQYLRVQTVFFVINNDVDQSNLHSWASGLIYLHLKL